MFFYLALNAQAKDLLSVHYIVRMCDEHRRDKGQYCIRIFVQVLGLCFCSELIPEHIRRNVLPNFTELSTEPPL